MKELVPPHGGILSPLIVQDEVRIRELSEECRRLLKIPMSSQEVSDVIMLGSGAFTPLKGFMDREDYKSVVREMRMTSAALWPMPVTLAVNKEQAKDIKEGQAIALLDSKRNEIMARLLVTDKYTYNRREEAKYVFGTEDENHPGVAKLYQQGEVYIGGTIEVLSEGEYPEKFPEYAGPAETRNIFIEKGWSTVSAFQTRNPLHLSHEYLIKIAMEISDGVLIHPVVGELKQGDIPAEIRMKCYQVLIDKYFPKDRVVIKVYPMEMRFCGPREAVLHAIIRQNFGCSHLVVGRDHAGVGSYYGPFDAQKIFDELEPDDLAIKVLKLEHAFWCYQCSSMASIKTCPHSKGDRLLISGTELRKMLKDGRRVPAEFIRPEVIDILSEYYRSQKEN